MPFANVNGQELFYEDSGGSGPAVIFMHGFLLDQSMFDPQVAALAPDYRCVRFDARAFGQTKWDGKRFSLYDTAADCLGLMDALGIDKAVLVGMSQGGYAAVRFAVTYPKRVQALVFLSTHNDVDDDEFKESYRSLARTWLQHGPVDMLVDNLLMVFLGENAELQAAWRDKFKARTGKQIEAAINNLVDRDEVGPDKVATITMPALCIHGEADKGIPIALGERLYKSLPNAKRFVRVPGGAHAVNLQFPDAVNAALRAFLAEVVQA